MYINALNKKSLHRSLPCWHTPNQRLSEEVAGHKATIKSAIQFGLGLALVADRIGRHGPSRSEHVSTSVSFSCFLQYNPFSLKVKSKSKLYTCLNSSDPCTKGIPPRVCWLSWQDSVQMLLGLQADLSVRGCKTVVNLLAAVCGREFKRVQTFSVFGSSALRGHAL